ncbi:hypothetical protein [Acinetobacter sp. ANC 5502]
MGTITKRVDSNGKVRFRAQVCVQRKDLPVFQKSKTFTKESLAKEWIKKLEAEIQINPDILNPETKTVSKTLDQFIERYIEEIGNEFAGTKKSALKNICNYDIAQKDVYSLSRQDFSTFAIERRKGNPMEMLNGVSPSTTLKDLSRISSVLGHAELVWGENVVNAKNELSQAIIGLKKLVSSQNQKNVIV